jgi:hypothetical protein
MVDQDWARQQAWEGDELLENARRILRKAQRQADQDLLPAVIDLLDRVHIHLFEIHTGTGNA